jgi:hypothetical protein
MNSLRYTLLTDGSSDRALLPLLTWVLIENGVTGAIQPEWADLRRVKLPRSTLAVRIEMSLALYPCDILFVHRDAEAQPWQRRQAEIQQALAELDGPALPVSVHVIPVRMQEAWLLFDEAAIKAAAGNRHYAEALELPPLNRLESLPNPKAELYDRLKRASGLSGRRLRSLNVARLARLVAQNIESFEPLRQLEAFRRLEQNVRVALGSI